MCHIKEIVKLINSCINFLNKRLAEKPVILSAERKNLVLVWPFLDMISFDFSIRVKKSIIRVIFKSLIDISIFSQFIDKII